MRLVVIPARNEASTVGQVVQAVREADAQASVLVVDDHSCDATARVAARAGADVVTTVGRPGYGAAIATGFAYARGQGFGQVATLDADGQHHPPELPALFDALGSADIASGSRYLSASGVRGVPVPAERLRINQALLGSLTALTGWSLTDAFCGYKAYRVAALGALSLDEPGYAFPLQLWVQAWHAGCTVTEVPVSRIYLPVRRRFGDHLDDGRARLAYYQTVLDREVARVRGVTGVVAAR